jgi:hypothetical protein
MKKLNNLTDKEYKKLDKAGMLYVLYPEATGDYELDVKDSCGAVPTFKVGDWVYTGYSPLSFGRIESFYDVKHVEIKCAQGSGTIVCVDRLKLATPSEIEQHLMEYAKKTYKVGMNVISPYTGREVIIKDTNFKYPGGGVTVYTDNCWSYIYTPGQGWAEIIKEEVIKIGGHEVKKHSLGINIGCEEFNTGELCTISRLFNICKKEDMVISINDEELVVNKNGKVSIVAYDKLFDQTLLEKF